MNRKTKIMISSLIVSLGLTGCSFHLNKINNNRIIVKNNNEIVFDNDNYIDEQINMKEKQEKYLKFDYLIDKSECTNTTLAHVIEEKTIKSKDSLIDKLLEKEKISFNESIIQPIILPRAFELYDIESIDDLLEAYGDCTINYKKLYTLEGDILYYIDSTITFNSFAESYIGLDIKENDIINSKVLYKVEDSNELTILYKNQTGVKEKSNNVLEKNYNNENEIFIPIEDTIYNDINGSYSEEELKEIVNNHYYKKESSNIKILKNI